MRHVPKWALRILDSRWLSRVRAVVFLGTVGVGAVVASVLVLDGLLLALVKALTHVGAVPLVFIGLGLFVGLSALLADGAGRVRGRLAERSIRATVEGSSAALQAALPPSVTPQTEATEYSDQPIFDQAPPELADMTRASLGGLIAGRTDAQAKALMKQHAGKPVCVSGEIENVTLASAYSGSVRLRGRSGVAFLLFFEAADREAERQLLVALNLGDGLAVSGEINDIVPSLVALDGCKPIGGT
jgi:hypothetical protein